MAKSPTSPGSTALAAPWRSASSRRAGSGSTATTSTAPDRRASCTLRSPMAPIPKTITFSPTRTLPSRTAAMAKLAGSMQQAASGVKPGASFSNCAPWCTV